MQKTIHSRDSNYPFEQLLDDIENNLVGTALYVSALTAEQMQNLAIVLNSGKHGLRQITFLNCATKGMKHIELGNDKPFHEMQMTFGWGDKYEVSTLYCKDFWANSVNEVKEVHVNIQATFETIKSLWCTPLFTAVMNDNLELVSQLLANGANPNIVATYLKDERFPFKEEYRYPLQQAVSVGNIDMVKLLLAHGADPHSSIFMEGTAIDLACESSPAIFQLFARAGCLLDCELRADHPQLLAQLANVAFPLTRMCCGFDKTPMSSEIFPAAANSREQLVQMLTAYNEDEKALLAKVCRFALLRCEADDPMRQYYFNLINLCTGDIPSLKSLAAMTCVKLDNGGLCRNLPNFDQHMGITLYGDQFHLSNLPQDLITEIFGMDQLLNTPRSIF